MNQELTLQEIKDRLRLQPNRGFQYAVEFPELKELLTEPPKPAAVLILFLWKEGEWHLLFTRRTTDLHEHSGQVAFPGGRMDALDDCVTETALREAHEEIGLDPRDVHVLGRLNDYLTITNYLVTPVVGTMPWPYSLHASQHEVSRIFTIPLAWLANPQNHAIKLRKIPGWEQPVPVVYFQSYDNEVLWGASARFTLGLLDILHLNGKVII